MRYYAISRHPAIVLQYRKHDVQFIYGLHATLAACVNAVSQKSEPIYSGPPLIRPPYLPRNYGHIREVAFGEREK